ncbi:hypothetical protein ROSINTL182_05432 [Roseburia intestinalis L1-82]|jgi:hypothetical protein|uniref:Uncharacterized protein n=1 Tax=Roseburia intestinalis L1-82 TaxID=536231 RepID=C7G6B9_9FIRM|nr:hypothetical protein ROSINTL182_05432 [Roseburia intestinalis L1-82]
MYKVSGKAVSYGDGGGLNLRKYNDFAPIGLKSGFENVIHQFDIEISLICGFAPQMGDKSLVFWEV